MSMFQDEFVNNLLTFHFRAYTSLSPRTRIFLGFGLIAYGSFAMLAQPKVEEALGMTASEQERRDLEEKLKFGLHTVPKEA